MQKQRTKLYEFLALKIQTKVLSGEPVVAVCVSSRFYFPHDPDDLLTSSSVQGQMQRFYEQGRASYQYFVQLKDRVFLFSGIKAECKGLKGMWGQCQEE